MLGAMNQRLIKIGAGVAAAVVIALGGMAIARGSGNSANANGNGFPGGPGGPGAPNGYGFRGGGFRGGDDDVTGAVVLTGTARSGERGLTIVDVDGGGELTSTQPAAGRVAVSVYPWEIVIEPRTARTTSSARNRVPAEIVSMTAVGGRVRIALALKGAGVEAEVSIWKGAKHGWVPTDMPVYNKDAAERHWMELVALFDATLKG